MFVLVPICTSASHAPPPVVTYALPSYNLWVDESETIEKNNRLSSGRNWPYKNNKDM